RNVFVNTPYFGTLLSGIPSASAIPCPYAGSAFKQLPIRRILMNSGASPMARAVFSNRTYPWEVIRDPRSCSLERKD
ncbi:MAG TPA: hypothetical protein VF338_04475, partial [Leptolinea sp.]